MFRSLLPAAVIALAIGMFASARPLAALTPTVTPAPGQPTTPGTPQTPEPAGTPWPAPAGLQVAAGALQITNPDGSFIRPEERQYHVTAQWEVPTKFPGHYEVELAKRPRESGEQLRFTRVADPQASTARGGHLETEQRISVAEFMGSEFCIRVRAVTNTARAPFEAGPYATACATFGVADGAAPGPPSVGTGAGGRSRWLWLSAGGALLVVATGVALSVASRRRRAP